MINIRMKKFKELLLKRNEIVLNKSSKSYEIVQGLKGYKIFPNVVKIQTVLKLF